MTISEAPPPPSKAKRSRRTSSAPTVEGPPTISSAEVAAALQHVEVTLPSADHLDDQFFRHEGGRDEMGSVPPPSRNPTPLAMELDPREARLEQKMTPDAQMRRAKLAKYVKAAVGIAAVLCLGALVKVATARSHDADTHVAAASSPAVVEPEAKPAVEAPPPVAVAENGAAVPDPAAAPVDSAKTGEAWPAPEDLSTEESGKLAKEQKAASRLALERSEVKKAIEEGEKSVAHNPTDSEAWLILGAAYQAGGNIKDANRCYAACLKEGKGGPKGECAAMLRR